MPENLEALRAEVISGCEQSRAGSYPQAEVTLRRALDGLRSLPPDPEVDSVLATCLGTLVWVCGKVGHLAQFQAFYGEVVSLCEGSAELAVPLRAALRHAGSLFTQRGEWDEARAALGRCREAGGGPEETAECLCHLAALNAAQGALDQALAGCEEGLGLVERRSRVGALLLGQAGSILDRLGRSEQAEAYLREALPIDLGEPASRTLVAQLSLCLFHLERDREALVMLARALGTGDGADHPIYAGGHESRQLLQDFAALWPCLRRSLPRLEATCGPDDPVLAACLEMMGLLSYYEGDSARALEYLLRAQAIFQSQDMQPRVASILRCRAWIVRWGSRWDEAAALMQQGVEMARAALGPKHPEVQHYLGILRYLREQAEYTAGLAAQEAERKAMLSRQKGAWQEAVRRLRSQGLACPRCGHASRDHRAVQSARNKSYFVCHSCGRTFEPGD